MTATHAVYVLWGSYPEPGAQPSRYEFRTEAELVAFLFGVDLATGWMDATLAKPGEQCPGRNAEGEQCQFTVGHPDDCLAFTEMEIP
jgi:hypothetical protein